MSVTSTEEYACPCRYPEVRIDRPMPLRSRPMPPRVQEALSRSLARIDAMKKRIHNARTQG